VSDAGIRVVRRVGLAALGALHLWWAVYALAAPRSFFTNFPFGHAWTGSYPPFNDHLMADLGAAFATLALLLLLAAALDDRRVNLVVLAGVGCFGVVHLIFHATHQGLLPGGEYAASLVALVGGVLAPAALAVLAARAPR
jgi:hypothetical protein